jgi:3-mercaptopyruvate sulfurtransferase SseA
MNLRKCVLLLIVAMLALASVSDAQRTKSKSKASKSAKATSPTPANPADQPAMQPQATTEHKTEGEIERITVEELKEKLAKNAPVFIIDSRSQGSYDGSEIKIKGALRIPADEIESRLKEIPRDREIVVYCT